MPFWEVLYLEQFHFQSYALPPAPIPYTQPLRPTPTPTPIPPVRTYTVSQPVPNYIPLPSPAPIPLPCKANSPICWRRLPEKEPERNFAIWQWVKNYFLHSIRCTQTFKLFFFENYNLKHLLPSRSQSLSQCPSQKDTLDHLSLLLSRASGNNSLGFPYERNFCYQMTESFQLTYSPSYCRLPITWDKVINDA